MSEKKVGIRLIITFIIGLITGIYFKLVFNDSIVIGVMIGLLVSYIAMVSTVREIERAERDEIEK